MRSDHAANGITLGSQADAIQRVDFLASRLRGNDV
jgi:hypothetical protein